MKLKTLEHWKGFLGVILCAGSPWGAWASSGAQMETVAIIGVSFASLLAGLGAVHNLIDQTLAKAAERKAAKEPTPPAA